MLARALCGAPPSFELPYRPHREPDVWRIADSDVPSRPILRSIADIVMNIINIIVYLGHRDLEVSSTSLVERLTKHCVQDLPQMQLSTGR